MLSYLLIKYIGKVTILKKINFKNYRNFCNEQEIEWNEKENIIGLIGTIASGKSNILSITNYFRKIMYFNSKLNHELKRFLDYWKRSIEIKQEIFFIDIENNNYFGHFLSYHLNKSYDVNFYLDQLINTFQKFQNASENHNNKIFDEDYYEQMRFREI